MPTAKVCATPGCPNPAAPGPSRCLAHARPAWRAGSTNRKQTLPADWRDRRATVLQRDSYRCHCDGCPRCAGRPCAAPATDVDHAGHRDDHALQSLRSLCTRCHRHRSSSQGGTAPRTPG